MPCSSAIFLIHRSALIAIGLLSSATSSQLRGLAGEFHPRKEISQLEGGGFGGIGTVGRVVLDRTAELLAQRAGFGLRRIGRTHQRSPFLDRIGCLEREDDSGARG